MPAIVGFEIKVFIPAGLTPHSVRLTPGRFQEFKEL